MDTAYEVRSYLCGSHKSQGWNIFGWCITLFAQGLLLANGVAYFPQWLHAQLAVPIYIFNMSLMLSSIIVIGISIPFGQLVDARFSPRAALCCTIVITGGASLLLAVLSFTPRQSSIYAISNVIIFIILLAAADLSTIILNSMLRIHFNSDNIGLISGLGTGASWSGALLGLIYTFPFTSGIAISGLEGPVAAFFPSSIAFVILSFLGIVLLPKTKPDRVHSSKITSKMTFIISHKGTLPGYMLGSILIMGAVYAFQANVPAYLSVILSIPVGVRIIALSTILCGAAIGGFVVAVVRELKLYKVHKVINYSCIILAISASSFSCLRNIDYLGCIICFLAGGAIGALETSLREGFTTLANRSYVTEYFAYYGVASRIANLVGPSIMTATLMLDGSSSDGYRIGFVILSTLTLAGSIVLRAVTLESRAQ